MSVRRFIDTNVLLYSIVAAVGALGCSELCSEDMSHGRQIEGVTIVNPFR